MPPAPAKAAGAGGCYNGKKGEENTVSCACEKLAGPHMTLDPLCLGHLWIFESLNQKELAALMERAVRARHEPGGHVFCQGDPANQLYLIKGGRVKLSKVSENGDEITVDIRKAGDSLGEGVLNDELDLPFTATCLTPTITCGLSKEGFEKLVLAHPNIGLQVIKNLSRRVESLAGRVGSFSYTKLEERLYRVLKNVAAEHGAASEHGLALDMPLTHEELAFLVGAHRVSITRAMRGLVDSGRIIRQGKTLILAA